MANERVSLVICTRNRALKLEACLRSVAQVSSQDWELVVVDNGSTDGTAGVIDAMVDRIPVPMIRVVVPEPGLARARNAGVRAASGALLSFTDDDCYVSDDHIERVRDLFADERTGAGGGRVLLANPTDLPVTVQIRCDEVVFASRSIIDLGLIHGANMVIRRKAFDEIGGFDERLGAGARFRAAEDIDALSRVSWRGWHVRYDPRLSVAHDHGRSAAREHRRLLDAYACGRGAYFSKFVASRAALPFARAWVNSMRRTIRHERSLRSAFIELGSALSFTVRRPGDGHRWAVAVGPKAFHRA